MNFPKLFLGPMSKNIVDVIINLNNFGLNIGLIPSRRQIDFNGGYVNNWTTEEFVQYVKERNKDIVICRDHGGPKQGIQEDFGIASLITDCEYMDLIHIDPWKLDEDFMKCFEITANFINFCNKKNSKIMFEIGTEESIRSFKPDQLMYMLTFMKKNVKCFNQIKYAVIQSGTNLKLDMNTGKYEENKLREMIEICKLYNILSKEHNGDYLDSSLIQSKFQKGLDAINIAPEIGRMETECYLDKMDEKSFDKFFEICYNSNMWVKWLKGDNTFNPFENKLKLIKVCGHYVFSNSEFIKYFGDIDIKDCLYNKIKNRVGELI